MHDAPRAPLCARVLGMLGRPASASSTSSRQTWHTRRSAHWAKDHRRGQAADGARTSAEVHSRAHATTTGVRLLMSSFYETAPAMRGGTMTEVHLRSSLLLATSRCGRTPTPTTRPVSAHARRSAALQETPSVAQSRHKVRPRSLCAIAAGARMRRDSSAANKACLRQRTRARQYALRRRGWRCCAAPLGDCNTRRQDCACDSVSSPAQRRSTTRFP